MRQIFLMLLTPVTHRKTTQELCKTVLTAWKLNLQTPTNQVLLTLWVQAHHSKLWFAGHNENWKLGDFEVHELMETIEDIQKFQSDRRETPLMGMIISPLDSINKSIQQKNAALFKTSYTALTNACNECHQAVEMEFNIVTIPDTSPFTNQDFKPID